MKKGIKNRVACILDEQHLTPYRLAKLLGIPPQTVYAWCKNKVNPSQQYLVELVRILGVTLDELLEIEYE